MDKFLLALRMIPVIVTMVKTAEELIPGQGKGKQKLDLVLNTIMAVATTVPEVIASTETIPESKLRETITAVVTPAVTAFNEAGTFDHAPAPPVQP